MPHLHFYIGCNGPATANTWARANGFADIRLPFERVLGKPKQIAVFTHRVRSLEPEETRLDLEFVIDTGMYFAYEDAAGAMTIKLYHELTANDTPWRLPENGHWGLWFRCKGPFDDIFISPANYETQLRRFEHVLMSG